jgi:hypothetical protein
MDLKLQDLRRYAIANRLEIRFGDRASGRWCLVNTKGQVKIPDENKELRVEEVLDEASDFELSGPGKPQQISRDAMAALLESVARPGVAAAASEDE